MAFVPGLVKQGRTEKVSTLVENAQQQLVFAGQTADPAEKRKYLEETRRLASEALRNEPKTPWRWTCDSRRRLLSTRSTPSLTSVQ